MFTSLSSLSRSVNWERERDPHTRRRKRGNLKRKKYVTSLSSSISLISGESSNHKCNKFCFFLNVVKWIWSCNWYRKVMVQDKWKGKRREREREDAERRERQGSAQLNEWQHFELFPLSLLRHLDWRLQHSHHLHHSFTLFIWYRVSDDAEERAKVSTFWLYLAYKCKWNVQRVEWVITTGDIIIIIVRYFLHVHWARAREVRKKKKKKKRMTARERYI